MHTITSEILVAYSQCPRKAFLLLSDGEKDGPHEYVRILERHKNANRTRYINGLRQKNLDVSPYAAAGLDSGEDVLVEATLEAGSLEAYCDVLKKVEHNSTTGKYAYEPTIAVGTYSISKEQKLELLFAGYVLGELQGAPPVSGSIVGMGDQVHKLKLGNSRKVLKPLIDPLSKWLMTFPSDPPPVILSKPCPYCQFRGMCQDKAEKDDDLSLLDRMTPKLIKRYHNKGIFTVKQLSFLYKPRRNRKRKKKTVALHKLELQALAIRTGKIYIQELPELPRHQIELFLDIEGIPDQNLYYLLGLLVCDGDNCSYHFFWADTPQDEARIWRQLLEKMGEYPEALIYHYGSYEPKAIRQMAKRYQADYEGLKKRLVNLNGYIYGKVYFPVRSNSLKEIGSFIGASWTSPDASGLQSLVWRHLWEETQETEYKQLLIAYNQEDYIATKLLADELRRICNAADSHPDIDFADQPKQQATEIGDEIHSQFKAILKSAHAGYDQKKVGFRQSKSNEKKKRGAPKGHQGYQRVTPRARELIRLPQRGKCPRCEGETLQASEKVAKKTVIDFVFADNGCRKTIIKYEGPKGYCQKCERYYAPESLNEYGDAIFGHGFQSMFGRGLQSWLVYQRLSLRLPYDGIAQSLEEQFGESINKSTLINIIRSFASYYADTEESLLQHILANPLVHVDETKISIEGVDEYIWVFTDGKHAIFRVTETREATIAHDLLEGYSGTIITDFYSGYDSIKCRQQKCWGHLIRDLNDDLWKSPFDAEFEMFVWEVKKLIVPILEAADEYGLKTEYLGRFKQQVDQFYERVIDNQEYHSEVTLKYQKRFKRYRQSLFTFLEYDSIPWNNNAAERALRHLTVQEKISRTFYKSVMQQYLLLLGIMQTCRFQEKSFLKFLLSGQKDIDKFESPKPARSSRAVGAMRSIEKQ